MTFVATGIIGGAIIGAGASAYAAKKGAKATQQAADAATAEQRRQFDLIREDQAPYRQLGTSAIGSINRLYGYAPTAPAQEPMSLEDFISSKGGAETFPTGTGILGGDIGRQLSARKAYDDYVTGFKPEAPVAPAGPDMSVFFESPDYQFNLGEGQKAIDRSLAARGGALSGRGVKEGQRFASGLASSEFSNFYNRLASQAGIGQTATQATGQAGLATAGNIGNIMMNAGNARANAYGNMAAGVNSAAQGGISNLLLQRYLSATPTGTPGYGNWVGPR